MFNSSSQARSTSSLRRRRRVPLACTNCRHRKSRCNGERPNCLPCLDRGVNCVYEEASRERRSPQGVELKYGQIHPKVIGRCKANNEDREKNQLKQRVRELEAKLRSISAASPDVWSKDKTIAPQTANQAGLPAIKSQGPYGFSSTTMEKEIDDVQVDTLATAAFNDVPDSTYRDIGCFGSTSNHALFRSLSGIFARLLDRNSPPMQQGSFTTSIRVNGSTNPAPLSIPVKDSEVLDDVSEAFDPYALPRDQDIELLINKFSTTVGMVLPFVNTPKLQNDYQTREHKQLLPRPTRVLLNIICAYASSTLRSADSRAYYHRALALMDEKMLRGSSLELIQALLLIGSFEQNNQRSVASWTLHAISVKAAFQQGLHSRSHYKHHTLEESELRKRVWYAVVNQDRYLSISLGRPCMIPQQHIHVEQPRNPISIIQDISLKPSESVKGLLYFDRIISIDILKCSIIDSLYNHNIDFEPPTTKDLFIKRLQLSYELEKWQQETSSFCEILSAGDISQWSSSYYSANRFQVLLSIEYYSVMLLINGTVIIRFLSEFAEEKQSATYNAIQIETMVPVVKKEFETLNNLSTIVDGAFKCEEAFLECNAAWWKCNYIMFTVNLHLFAILLLCRFSGAILSESGIEMAHVRSALDRSLNILRNFEKASLMSRKACHCISGFLRVLDSLASDQLPLAPLNSTQEEPAVDSTSGLSWMIPEDISMMSESLFSHYVAQSADDFLFQCSDTAFLNADMNFFWDDG